MDSLVIMVAVIIAVVIGAMFLGRIVRRGVARAGDRYETRALAERRDAILDDLGTPLVVHASETATREILDLVTTRQPRRFTALDDGAYGIRFVEADDAVVRLVVDSDGTRMQVERSAERLGMPQNVEFWRDLRSQVASEAEARGIATADGARHLFSRADGDPSLWVISAPGDR